MDETPKLKNGDKIMVTPDGERTSLGTTKFQDYLKLSNLALLKTMLEKAGFQNVGFKAENLSPSGNEIECALVAEKPGGKVLPRMRSVLRHRVRRIMRRLR